MRLIDSGRLGLLAGSLGLAPLAGACGGPSLADLEQDEVSLTVTAVASAPAVAALGESQGGLGVTRAFVSMSAVTLLPCLADAGELELGARGYELAAEPPMTERVTTAVSELCGLRLDLDPVAANASEGIPEGASLYVAAQPAEGEAISLMSERSASLMFAAEAGASFGDQPLLLGFDLSTWLAGLPEADGMHEGLFDSQLLAAAALYVDSNGNSALDADEQAPVARAARSR